MLNGYAAEEAIARLVSEEKRFKIFHLPDSREILKVLQSSPVGRGRLEKAEPYLKREFGIPTRNGRLHLFWESIPSKVLLDYCLGIDVCFNFLGWGYGLDVTVNPVKIEEKFSKLKQLKPLLNELQLERIGVLLVQSIPTAQNLKFPKNEIFVVSV
jgi:hypothetical protein